MLTNLFDPVSQFLTTLSLWLQVPLVMIVAVPLAAVFAVALLRLVDASSYAWTRFWGRSSAGGDAESRDSDSTGSPH